MEIGKPSRMIDVLLSVDPRYHVNRKLIRKAIVTKLQEQGITSNAEVSVSIVGMRKMRQLTDYYMRDDEDHDVLSFPLTENITRDVFINPPDGIVRLGDIVLAHPMAVEQAAQEEKLVAKKINELIEHAVLHLLGHHHDDGMN